MQSLIDLDVLVDSVLQSFEYCANVPAVTAAHVLIYAFALLKGRHRILDIGSRMHKMENIN